MHNERRVNACSRTRWLADWFESSRIECQVGCTGGLDKARDERRASSIVWLRRRMTDNERCRLYFIHLHHVK